MWVAPSYVAEGRRGGVKGIVSLVRSGGGHGTGGDGSRAVVAVAVAVAASRLPVPLHSRLSSLAGWGELIR